MIIDYTRGLGEIMDRQKIFATNLKKSMLYLIGCGDKPGTFFTSPDSSCVLLQTVREEQKEAEA
jgi:hypothetical protein